MARFVDLDEEDSQAQPMAAWHDAGRPLALGDNGAAVMVVGDGIPPARRFPSRKSTMTEKLQQENASASGEGKELMAHSAMGEAFQCYPVVFGIVSHIDLNTLDALARSCRVIHDGLIQYRASLMGATLRCSKEAVPVDPEQTLRYRARASDWNYGMEDSRNYNGKAGSCARDLVTECRRCADIICRNCAIKPPLMTALRERHRRLCVTCAKAPIAALASPALDISLPLTSEAVQRAVCQCDTEGVWLCQPCGHSIRNADHDYKGIWRWRTKYGGFTGIGDGDRGVICGREEACLAAREKEQEIDCDAEDARGSTLAPWSTGSSSGTPSPGPQHTGTPPGGGSGFPFPTNGTVESIIEEMRHQRTPSPQLGPGYERHEIEGIGGIVKRKLVRMVRVGACVPEWEDEKNSSNKILAREVNGAARSWCGWCWRVIPGDKDKRQCAKS
ncbi:hypothetical protein Trihar35433_7137 [Trichoderma harzianum]|nr:hypothetical protein Trihar35433_7137 [Trichoderma harzianum]